jgi:hypothetical protein
MEFNPAVMQAVEQLNYRVTIGDVASKIGIDLNTAERGVLALASNTGAHFQVSEQGEIAYVFPANFRGILQRKFWRLRAQAILQKLWNALFYLIRISFGILLIVSIVLIAITIVVLIVAMNSSNRDNDNRRSSSSGSFIFFPRFLFGPDLFWIFSPDYGRHRYTHDASYRSSSRLSSSESDREMNFLEAVFSFLFGDGNPNADLEERRWQAIATTIRNNGGAIAAEQVAPYLDEVTEDGTGSVYEDYMLPVLTRFNGRPEVTPDGQIIYHFPELQVTAAEYGKQPVPAYLKEKPWLFSEASAGKLMMAAGLGVANLVLAVLLGFMLQDQALVAEIGGLVVFVNAIFPALLAYGTAFLGIPLVRYFWIKRRNRKVIDRNEQREQRAIALNQADTTIRQKITYAQKFARETVVRPEDLAYTTEKELTEQEVENREKLDAEWQQRLDSGS